MPIPTVAEFRNDPHLYERLAQLLNDPVWQAAESLVKRILEPRMPVSMTDEAAKRMGAYSAGGYATIRTFQALATKAPKQSEQPEEYDGWNAAAMTLDDDDGPKPPTRSRTRKPRT